MRPQRTGRDYDHGSKTDPAAPSTRSKGASLGKIALYAAAAFVAVSLIAALLRAC